MLFFGVGIVIFFSPRRSGPSPVRGRKDLIPTAALYALFTTSLQLSLPVPRVSCTTRSQSWAGQRTPCLSPLPPAPPVRPRWPGTVPSTALRRQMHRRTSGRDEPYRVAEEHSREKATRTPLQKCLGKAAGQALNPSTRSTVEQKAPISSMNYSTACTREMKYTHNPSPNHRG